MQPIILSSSERAKPSQRLSESTTPINPRTRNRLHNQAIKRAKANIGKRRGPALPQSQNDEDDPRHIQPLVTATTLATKEASPVAPSPKLTVTSGGLRGDPFCAFPISADVNVLSSVDYFLQVYAPVHINPRKEQLGPADSLQLSRRYFGLALENASLFELMVSLAAASHAARRGITRAPTREVLVHYGKGIEALRLKMAKSASSDDDATLLSVMALLGIALMYSDFSSFEIHLTGLRHLVELRGGVDNLGWNGFIKNSITGLESVWAYHENKKLTIATTEANTKLEYPTHPFPPDLCVTIAKLPDGLRDLALSELLSLQVITPLSRVSEWVNQIQQGRKKGMLPLGEPNGTYLKQTHLCLELVPLRGLSLLERVLCFALVTLTTETFNKTKQQNPVHRRLIESLSEMLSRYNLSSLPVECAIWMALVVAGPSRPSARDQNYPTRVAKDGEMDDESRRVRAVLLDTVIQNSPVARNWTSVERIVQKFLSSNEILDTWKETWKVALLRYVDMVKEKEQRTEAAD